MKSDAFMAAKLVGTALILACSACNPKQSNVSKDMNGFILGNNTPMQALTVGIGDSLDRFFQSNPFLTSLRPSAPISKISLPIMKNIDASYDDGKVHFDVGCASTTNIEGDVKVGGVNLASFYLCNPSINDWEQATQGTERLIDRFASQNRDCSSLREFRKHHSVEESSTRWETELIDRFTKQELPLTEKNANIIFKAAADGGHVQQLRLQQGSSLLMESFSCGRLLVFFEIAKLRNRGGVNLSNTERNEMKYQTVFTFRQMKPKD